MYYEEKTKVISTMPLSLYYEEETKVYLKDAIKSTCRRTWASSEL